MVISCDSLTSVPLRAELHIIHFSPVSHEEKEQQPPSHSQCLIQFGVALRELSGAGWANGAKPLCVFPTDCDAGRRVVWMLAYLISCWSLWSSFLHSSLSHVMSFISCTLQLRPRSNLLSQWRGSQPHHRSCSSIVTQHRFSTEFMEQFKINQKEKRNNASVVFVSQWICNSVSIRESHLTSPTVTWLPAVFSLLPSNTEHTNKEEEKSQHWFFSIIKIQYANFFNSFFWSHLENIKSIDSQWIMN